MTRLALRLLLTASAAALVALLNVSEADAHTCGSTCNQINRACGHAAKGVRKAALAQCNRDRDVCRDCGDDPNCPGWSPDCNDARVLCREAAHTAREQARNACRAARELCPPASCVDPIDGDCVRDCKSGPDGQKQCQAAAKDRWLDCKRAAPKDNERRRALRLCKKQLNEALALCSDLEALCLGPCVGLTP
jgi:hypothetical protein